jgi:hypothetical protein
MIWSTRHDIDDKVCAQHHSINKYMTKKTKKTRFFSIFTSAWSHNVQYISLLFQYFSRHFLLYLIFKCDHFGLKLKKEILVHLSILLPLSVTHITSQIYFFHISSMKCDSIHFNIMSDIVWSCWSENREKTFFLFFFLTHFYRSLLWYEVHATI